MTAAVRLNYQKLLLEVSAGSSDPVPGTGRRFCRRALSVLGHNAVHSAERICFFSWFFFLQLSPKKSNET